MTQDIFQSWVQLRGEGQPEAAHALLLEALQEPPLVQQAMACLAIEHASAGRWGKAFLPLLQACMEPAEWAYHALLAQTLMHLGRNDLAVTFLQAGLQRRPDNAQLRSVYWQAALKALPLDRLRQEARVFLEVATDPAERQQLQAIIGKDGAIPVQAASGSTTVTRSTVQTGGTDAALPHVDILVPVFGSYVQTRRCLESVISAASKNQTPSTLIVLDDAGPEAKLTAYLHGLAEAGQIELHRHQRNLGFIENVNYGMRLNERHDVIWLNSDTVVHGDWLDRLQRAAFSRPKVASVTPWSNNGELLSLVQSQVSSAMPSAAALAEIDNAVACLQLPPVDIPGGCGFCFYIPRAALNDVGYLNSTDLRRGYGEETEWSMRAKRRGWVHLAATDTFVGHEGGSSFGLEKALRVFQNNGWIKANYPETEAWFKDHPGDATLDAARQQIQLARLPTLLAWVVKNKPLLEVVPGYVADLFPFNVGSERRASIRLVQRVAADGQTRVTLQAPLEPEWRVELSLPADEARYQDLLKTLTPTLTPAALSERQRSTPGVMSLKQMRGHTWLIADALDDADTAAAWLSLAQQIAQLNQQPGAAQTTLCFIEPGPHAQPLRATGAVFQLPRLQGLAVKEQIKLANLRGVLTLKRAEDAPAASPVDAQSIARRCQLALHALRVD